MQHTKVVLQIFGCCQPWARNFCNPLCGACANKRVPRCSTECNRGQWPEQQRLQQGIIREGLRAKVGSSQGRRCSVSQRGRSCPSTSVDCRFQCCSLTKSKRPVYSNQTREWLRSCRIRSKRAVSLCSRF